jgi:hypothetical protein
LARVYSAAVAHWLMLTPLWAVQVTHLVSTVDDFSSRTTKVEKAMANVPTTILLAFARYRCWRPLI